MKTTYSPKKPTATLHVLTVLFLLLAIGHAMYRHSRGDANYTAETFTTEYQMRTLLHRNADDLRLCHTVIRRSRDLLLAQKAAFICRDLWLQDKDNPKRMALYSCAYAVADADSGLDRFTLQQERLRKQLQPYREESEECLNKSVQQLPQSAEVQVMASMGFYNRAKVDKALNFAEKGLKLDPRWPYAHYWLSRSLVGSAMAHQSDEERLTRRALTEMQWVEKHAPALSQGHELHYVNIYSNLRQYPEAVAYMDKIIARADAAHPRDKQQVDWQAAKPILVRWRQSLVAQVK